MRSSCTHSSLRSMCLSLPVVPVLLANPKAAVASACTVGVSGTVMLSSCPIAILL